MMSGIFATAKVWRRIVHRKEFTVSTSFNPTLTFDCDQFARSAVTFTEAKPGSSFYQKLLMRGETDPAFCFNKFNLNTSFSVCLDSLTGSAWLW